MRHYEFITEDDNAFAQGKPTQGLPSFLNPKESLFYKPAMAQMIETLKRSCKPYLSAIGNDPRSNGMYRGMVDVGNDNDKRLGLKTVRLNDREPLATGRKDHDKLNQYFDSKYGHPYRNGLFVSGRQSQAEEYGTVYSVFPVGKFDFIWHDTISDLYVSVLDPMQSYAWWKDMAKDKGVIDDIRADVAARGIPPESADYNQEVQDGVFEWINEKTATDLLDHMNPYHGSDLLEGINSGHEIMIWAEQYYYLVDHLVDSIDWTT